MKHLFVVFFLAAAFSAKCQNLVFSVDQLGSAIKKAKSAAFEDAELQNANTTIYVQNNKLIVSDSTNTMYTLVKRSLHEQTPSKIAEVWAANDEQNCPVNVRYTINRRSKDAVIEVSNNKKKRYYFGTCASLVFNSH